jgi:hypothetical protein
MSIDRALGWQITVERPDSATVEVYNVAIPDGQQAIEAVKRLVKSDKGVVLKLKGELTAKVFKALQMKPGDVLAGAQPRKAHAGKRQEKGT